MNDRARKEETKSGGEAGCPETRLSAESSPSDPGGRSPGGSPLPPDAIIVLPSRNTVLFPGVVLPMTVGRKRSVEALQEAVRSQAGLAVVLQRDPQVNDPGPTDLYSVGASAAVLRYIRSEEG